MIDQIFFLILFNELETSQRDSFSVRDPLRDYTYTLACDCTYCVIQENPVDIFPPEGPSFGTCVAQRRRADTNPSTGYQP